MGFPGGSEVKASACNAETWVRSLGPEDPLEKELATHSSILAWRISWTEKPGGLQSTAFKESDMTERLHFHFIITHLEISPYLPELVLGLFVLIPIYFVSQELLSPNSLSFQRPDGFGQWEALAEDRGRRRGKSRVFLPFSVCYRWCSWQQLCLIHEPRSCWAAPPNMELPLLLGLHCGSRSCLMAWLQGSDSSSSLCPSILDIAQASC